LLIDYAHAKVPSANCTLERCVPRYYFGISGAHFNVKIVPIFVRIFKGSCEIEMMLSTHIRMYS